ncbi:uncharacterized protein LOC131546011 [Onychostoma macrolepis]|uniref:uncharacterized protein LOC131546011 n=1 Tax=Onychostoma macrolepis TaxID=369639 RepID=UPI00272D223A|nr:uncharacterized protein LOC131546011 [Onychostoma macrolepis]
MWMILPGMKRLRWKGLQGCGPSSAAVDRKCESSLCNTSCLAVQLQSRWVLDARKMLLSGVQYDGHPLLVHQGEANGFHRILEGLQYLSNQLLCLLYATCAAATVLRQLFGGSGETPGRRIQHWMISLEEHIICEGIQTAFLSGFAADFSTYNNFNLQYQAEVTCTLEFIQRWFIEINPEKVTKAGGVISKRMEKVTQKKKTVNPRVSSLLKIN